MKSIVVDSQEAWRSVAPWCWPYWMAWPMG
jgi:hypothetical protein